MKIVKFILLALCVLNTYTSKRFAKHLSNHKLQDLGFFLNLPYISARLAGVQDKTRHEDEGIDMIEHIYVKRSIGKGYEYEAFSGYTDIPEPSVLFYFRGSVVLENWVSNFKYDLTKFDEVIPNCKGCKVHKGFLKGFKKIQDKMFEKYEALIKRIPSDVKIKQVFFLGFSMGSALANLAAALFINKKNQLKSSDSEIHKRMFDIPDINLITFGAPRVGNPEFAEYMNNLLRNKSLKRNYRIVYKDDPVANMPSKKILNITLNPLKAIGNAFADKLHYNYSHAGIEITYLPDSEKFEVAQDDQDRGKSIPLLSLANKLLKKFKSHHLKYGGLDGEKLWNTIQTYEGK